MAKKKNKNIKKVGIKTGNKLITNLILLTLLIIIMTLCFMVGYKVNDYFINNRKDMTVGLYSKDFCGYGENWIHVRVDEDVEFERLIEVCNHEAGHALFCKMDSENCFREISENYAEVCENYPRLCLNDVGEDLNENKIKIGVAREEC